MGKLRRRRRGEHYYLMAKKAGYRSRAAFKIAQLNRRHNLIKEGDIVVDLGAAPGGWLQVARENVGRNGFVLGVDLQPIARFPYENVKTIVADITHDSTPGLIGDNLPGPADVIISDASPKITGAWTVDHSRSIELAYAALTLAEHVLKPGGRALIKVFQGKFFEDYVREVKKRFEFVKVSKPAASRKGSAEIYVIGKRFKSKRASR
jgi:23S rRNA (uridine2552-2'-O)-methyltransferase